MGTVAKDALLEFARFKWAWKPLVRRLVTGSWAPLVMRPAEASLPGRLRQLGLYLHVPFCRNLCPYCPYNRVEYEESLYRRFEDAAHQEIELYARRFAETFSGGHQQRPRNKGKRPVGRGDPGRVPGLTTDEVREPYLLEDGDTIHEEKEEDEGDRKDRNNGR